MLKALCLFLLLGGFLAAEDTEKDSSPTPPPQLSVKGTYGFVALDPTVGAWSSTQSLEVFLSGRWGQAFLLQSDLLANFNNAPLSADQLFTQLAVTWNLGDAAVVTFGKQRLKWGTAKVFSAIDSLEPVADPTNQNAVLPGVTGGKIDYLPTDWLSFSVLALPTPVLSQTKLAVRSDLLWNDTDLGVGAVRLVAQNREQQVVFADAARYFDRFGFYGEMELKSFRDRDWSWTDGATTTIDYGPVWIPKFTVGVQMDFPAWLHGTITWLNEYHYNGEGFDSAEAGDFARAYNDPAKTAFSPPNGLGVGTYRQHYAYTGFSGVPLNEKLTTGISLLAGLDSGFLMGTVGLNLAVDQTISGSLAYDRFGSWRGEDSLSESLFLNVHDRITVNVSAAY